ncbi:MAG: patatin-like phospholipase family protein [Chloroflexota bacterium]
MKNKIVCLIIIFLVSLNIVQAQKVGLVLSGGGAKGVSHIGVIRALEEAEIPIDYITGTSMGAIIGGLYASGYSPNDMERLINSPEFKNWSTGTIDPKYTYYFKLPPKTASWFDFKFSVDSTVIKPSLPTNLVSPMMMDFAFLEIFADASAAADYDFNNLMVPFKCIASDIARAQQVVLEKGDLGKAIRASMTFPFYFKPIQIDSVLLFDGGMYNNFPSDVMLADFNPDIIIGSQASANAEAPQMNNVMSQIQNMLMMKSKFDVLCDNSVLIKPNLLNVNVIDFSHTQAFIDSGYYQTKRMLPKIREFVTEHRTKAQADSLREAFNSRKPELVIGSIQINGLRPGQYDYISQLLRRDAINLPGKRIGASYLTLEMIKPQYFAFVAEGRVDHIYPELHYYKDDKRYNLTIDLEKQNQLTTEVGGTITSSSVNELFLQLRYLLWTSKSINFTANSYFGRFYNSALFETRIDFPSYRPFYLSGGFVFNKFNYFKTSTFFYADDDPFFLIQQERFGYLSLGFPVHNNGKIAVDLTFGSNKDQYYQTNTYSKGDKLDRTSFNYIAPGVQFEINTLNYKEYPNSGANLKAEVHLVTGSENYYPGTNSEDITKLKIQHTWLKAKVDYVNYFERVGRVKLGVYGSVNFSTQSNYSNYTSSLLASGQFQPVSESSIRFMPVFRNYKFAGIGSQNIYSFNKNFDFRLEGYIYMALNPLTKDPVTLKAEKSSNIKFYPIASSVLVYRTPLGPVSANLNYFSGEDKPLSFFLKLGYLIFNRRPY